VLIAVLSAASWSSNGVVMTMPLSCSMQANLPSASFATACQPDASGCCGLPQ
jgi:hypothetical protein